MALNEQMKMFEDGGLKDEGGMVDEVSGNDVPPGSTREEVRDDIPAQLSEGEFVFPADVVRFIGLEKLMQMRQKAKMGLQKMEEMGQMGNSEEATIPDDMPFDINDLDMEDEVEYNRGGVVEAANGTFVQNAMPITYNPLNTTQTNTVTGNPTQMQAPMDTSNPYTGNPQTAYKTGIQPYAPVDYTTALGTSAVGAPQTESVRYFNAATGQSRTIPHMINADGSRGATLFPVPDGFVIQEEAPKEEAKKTTKIKSTKVAPVDSDDGGEGFDDYSTTDQSGIGFNKSTLQSSDLKGLFDNVSVMESLGKLSLSYNLGRSLSGKGNVAGAKGAAIGGILDGFRGGNVTYNGTNQRNTGLQSGTYDNNKSLNDLSFAQQSQIGRVGNVVFSTVIEPMLYDIDVNGKKTARSDISIRNSAIQKAKDLGLPVTIPGTIFGLRTNTILRSIAKKEYEIGAKKDTAFDVAQRSTTEEDSVYGDTDDKGKGADVGFNVGQQSASDFYSDYSGPSSGMTDADTAAAQTDDGSFAGGYEDDDMYNKGGLAGKKKTPKPKKMKRGGLASR